MGGRLFATSQVNRGSVFSFEIKLGRATPANSAKPDDSPKCDDHLSGLSILIVDDWATIRMLVAEMLKQHGGITETLSGAEAAISHIQNHPASIDLILMDIQMPGMDGIKATRELKAMPETCAIPIIAITAGVLGEQRQRSNRKTDRSTRAKCGNRSGHIKPTRHIDRLTRHKTRLITQQISG